MSGMGALEYRIDGGEIRRIELAGENTVSFPIPPTYNGYAVVELWVYDLAGNSYHDTFWYWLEGGVVKSVQPVKDGRFRVTQVYTYKVVPEPVIYNICEIHTLTVIPVPRGYVVIKIKDQRSI